MKRGTPENRIGVEIVNNQQEVVDTGKRRFVFGTIAGATTLAAEGALFLLEEQAKPALAAAKTAINFRERIKGAKEQSSPQPLTASSKSLDIPQVQPVTVQDTPTPDATLTALQKKLLQDQIKQLETPPQLQPQPSWLETNALTIAGLGLGVVGSVFGGYQYFRNQSIDREKRDEDRFQTIVSGLGSNDMATRTGAAVLLRTFLDPKYKESYQRFYQQIFDLTVAHLRLREVKKDDPLEPDQFYKEVIKLFALSAPLVVEKLQKKDKIDLNPLSESKYEDYGKYFKLRQKFLNASTFKDEEDYGKYFKLRQKFLNASNVHLEGADLGGADLRYIYMPDAALNGAYFNGADLRKAVLSEAVLSGARFMRADFGEAVLYRVVLNGTNLRKTDFNGANLREADLNGASLRKADFYGADLNGADFREANLREANLYGTNLGADFEHNREANPEEALSLQGTRMLDVKYYDDPQKRQKCIDKGAIFDNPHYPFVPPDTKGEANQDKQ